MSRVSQDPAPAWHAIITPATGPLRGTVEISGDKSVSIRRALLTLFTDSDVVLENYGSGEDCLTALSCLAALGKTVTRLGNTVSIAGGFHSDRAALDCRNSGTCARLLMGILAGRDGEWTITGDASLSSRPMDRVAAPLREMGADIDLRDGRLPARIVGRKLRTLRYDSPLASAQVKSAVLLAGLSSMTEISYREPVVSRRHTEVLLGLKPDAEGWIHLSPTDIEIVSDTLTGRIPGDPSSAAFWGVAASLIAGSDVRMPMLLADEIRCGWIRIMQAAGAKIEAANSSELNGEIAADIRCRAAQLSPFEIRGPEVPTVIDEIPVLALAATQARGTSRFSGIGELRVKESNRLTAIQDGLAAMGAGTFIENEELVVRGPIKLGSARIMPLGDHRIAMTFAVAALTADGVTCIRNAECASVSYPEFWDTFELLSPDSLAREPD